MRLVGRGKPRHKPPIMMQATPAPGTAGLFNRAVRAVRRDRAAGHGGYIDRLIAELLIERIDDVARRFGRALVIGARNPSLIAAVQQRCDTVMVTDSSAALAHRHGGLCGEEDHLPVEPGSFDLIVWPGGLDSVNDVPGALHRARLALADDGLLIGAVAGEGSFPMLRQAMVAGDAPAIISRMHPQLSLQSVGDLLQAVGLAMIVTDIERVMLSYRTLHALIGDLRDAAMTNVLASGRHVLTRAAWHRAQAAFSAMAPQTGEAAGRTVEQLRLICFSGWAPHPDQPKAARRGSATASLAHALERRRDSDPA